MSSRKVCGLLGALALAGANASARADCRASEVSVVRIEYEAFMPMHVIAMAPRSEVERAFPGVNGVATRTVYVTPEKYVEVERGLGLKTTVVAPGAEAPGVHLGDGKGSVMKWVGYEKVPLVLMRIETRTDALSYSSLQGDARYERRGQPSDADTQQFLSFLESDLPLIGKQTYGGLECTAKRMPVVGTRSEACVVLIHGWPVALHLQLPGDSKQTNWYKATRIDRNACVSAKDLELPPGTKIEPHAPEADDNARQRAERNDGVPE